MTQCGKFVSNDAGKPINFEGPVWPTWLTVVGATNRQEIRRFLADGKYPGSHHGWKYL